MTWIKTRLWAVLSVLTGLLAMLAVVYGKGRSDANARRDAKDMTDAYNRERTRNEIESNIARDGNANKQLHSDWRRD